MTVVLSYGMGVDSTAILLHWLTNPQSRDFDLSELVVITAMTGDEFTETGQLVEDHIIPLLNSAGVRFVQVARGGARVEDGVVVLSDSVFTRALHLDGVYKLSDELIAAGTVPQVASGRRLCSIKQKGVPLDTWLADNIVGPFRHVMGFNADELRRVTRDSSYSTEVRHSEYPLVDWGWGRDDCVDFIESVLGLGRPWPKSCCTFCPFAQDNHLSRYADDPQSAVEAMMLEHVSMALNPRMTLFSSKSVIELVAGALPEAADLFYEYVASTEHALYDIRRVFHARRTDPTKKGSANRSVRVVERGAPVLLHRRLRELAIELGGDDPSIEHGVLRSWINRADTDRYPTVERFLVVAPSGVEDKQQPSFEKWWQAYRSPDLVLL